MYAILLQCFFLIVWTENLNGEVYQDRPRIKTSDGNLIIEPAFDKNIYLHPNGPKSNVFVGEVNILNTRPKNAYNDGFTESGELMNIANGVLNRISELEHKKTQMPASYYLNVSTLWRKVNNLNRKITTLETQLQNRRKDECKSNPCEHGGTCLNLANGFHCLCPHNWEGDHCDSDVNECRDFAGTDLGCQNAATCINRPGSYECLCKSGWFGLHCTRKAKDCSGGDYEMCGHGKCLQVSTGNGITCICHQGWTTNGTGVECLTDVNECESHQGCSVNPRVMCINLPGSFRCGPCPPGYEGDGFSCSDIDECIVLPNGGCNPMVSCHNTVGSRLCGPCPPGYEGDGIVCSRKVSCSVNHGGCHPSAQCIESIQIGGQGAQCVCPIGMDGDGYGMHGCYILRNNSTLNCATNPCGAHGQCHMLRSGFTCICQRGYGGSHCHIPTDQCASSPCQNGGLCRVDDNDSRGFRCECTSTYSGTLCQTLVRTCGGVLEAEEGNIAFPLTNNATYLNNVRCAWVIKTIAGKVINVTFSKFNLEEHDECLYDFLQIHDGRSSVNVLIGRFCGNRLPKGGNIVSSSNYLYLWFRSDHTVSKTGFALHWSSASPVCGGEIDATKHGRISSPGSPGDYPPNRDCTWLLTTSPGKRIQIHFFALDIESHPNCNFDYLAVYDGMRTDPLLAKYCNSSQPAPIQSSISKMLIHFHSDSYGSGAGFQLAYAPVEGIPGCGGLFTADKGEIASPSSDSYPDDLICEYQIRTNPNTKVRIDFKLFNLHISYGSPYGCRFEYLKIYDGPSVDSALVGTFCGNSYPEHYTSSSNALFLEFKPYLVFSHEGFKLTYNAICEINVVGDSGILKSPGYPFEYPRNTVCEYIIATTPGKAIELTFQDFNLESTEALGCDNDYVEIRDGVNVNATVLGKYCGEIEKIPAPVISTHNYMHLLFHSDMSVAGAGFYANYTTIDTECGGIFRTTPGTINHPSGDSNVYENNQICTWILIAPEGMHIQLFWNRFSVENSPKCKHDYLELIEVDDNNDDSRLGKFCGSTAPPAVTTATNVLKLVFTTDTNARYAGFSLSYKFLNKSHCGGTFIKNHGFIYSPGWPNRYETHQNCTWTIKGPVGQQIRLNISNFDLEISGKCSSGDYLEIRHGVSEIGRYCGQFKTKRVVSFSNVISIHFYSDSFLTGNGFKIEWDSYVTGCGGTLSSSSGSISSPNYPENYSENSECNYKIITSLGSRLILHYTDLNLEPTLYCKDDYVEIFDGKDTSAPSLGRHCVMSTDITDVVTTTNYAFIKFRSDFLISRKGFLLNYNTLCNNNITGRYGVIESPDFPNQYPSSLNCLWNITVPKGNKIKVVFNSFDIETTKTPLWHRPGSIWEHSYHYRIHHRLGHRFYDVDDDDDNYDDYDDYDDYSYGNRLRIRESCEIDYLQWKEKSEEKYSNKICGNTLPSMIATKENTLLIKFSSGLLVSKSGFRLEWILEGCGGHILKSTGTISVNSTLTNIGEIVCEWLIETDIGTSINLILSGLYLSKSPNCTTDAVEIYNGQDDSSPPLSIICQQGTSLIQSTANFMFLRFVKQSNLKGTYFSSSFTSRKAKCGGKMTSLSGFIYSKNYPKNYDNNLDCTWLISVPYHHRIQLNVIDLDLDSYGDSDEENADSCGDSIKIYDSESLANYTTIICSKTNVSSIITKYNKIMIQFTSDRYGSAKGFKIHYNVNCGARIDAVSDGIISNVGDLGGDHKSCTWTIIAKQLNQRISLTFTHISLPNDINANQTAKRCSSSYVRLFDGDDEQAPFIDEFCGNKVPPMIVSNGNAMTVVLGSNSGNVVGQFSAHYSPLIAACGGTMTSEEGEIASPNYPLSYHNNADCEWILSTSPGNRVYITFDQFSVEYSEGCNEDYLEIRENNGTGKLIGVYCGDEIPMNITAAAKLYIKFRSNDKSSAQNRFVLHFGFLHGNDFVEIDQGEISSPLFPNQYLNAGEYTWRILITGREVIILTIDNLQIHTYTEECINKLSIYDGYDNTAPLLGEFCGVLNSKTLQTTSNVAYIKLSLDETNTGALFNMRWTKSNKNLNKNKNVQIRCGSNNITTILPGNYITIRSPNLTEVIDNDHLNCEWVYQSTIGRHLTLRFQEFSIVEMPGCIFDSVSIYSSDNLIDWKSIKENQCTSESMLNQFIDTARYMKIQFKTLYAIKNAFIGQISSSCGGDFTALSGLISPTWNDFQRMFLDDIHTNTFRMKCSWTVKVRPERVINLKFLSFNITNNDDHCVTAVTLRNGGTVEAPFLSNGKYCGSSHENRDNITTSANTLFISYVSEFSIPFIFKSFEIYYEEQDIECGSTSSLNSDHSWEIISSPNYPSPPVPYSECIWTFTAPPGEVLRLDFMRFDLDNVDDCGTEVVELRNGPSNISPLLGRFCSEKPQTWKTSSNTMYIKYSTQLADPRTGFKANVSIDVCGGTIVSDVGEITSPGYPNMAFIQENTICEWTLRAPSNRIIQITPVDIDLPVSENPCDTKITIQQNNFALGNVANASATILRTICNNDYIMTPIESSSNEIKIQLQIGKPSSLGKRGFKFAFNSIRPTCGGTIKQSEGFLYTQGYPLETNIQICLWSIEVPNKLRRVRIELLDVEKDKFSIALFNDKKLRSSIQLISQSYPQTMRIFESSSNTLGVLIFSTLTTSKFKFKAKFSSDDQALCGGPLIGLKGELMSPTLNRSYACVWNYDAENTQTNEEYHYNTILLILKLISSTNSVWCDDNDVKLYINSLNSVSREYCKTIDTSFRIPASTMQIEVLKSDFANINFNITWNAQPCGGKIQVGDEAMNIIQIPSNFNDSLDCAWIVNTLSNSRVQFKMEGAFQFGCDDEYIKISHSASQPNSVIGKYCSGKTLNEPLITHYKSIYIEYHSKAANNNTNIQLMVKHENGQCGGELTDSQHIFISPNYPKNYNSNQECTWTITANVGYRILLKFIDRFAVEDRPNCTKDVLIVYDWIDTDFNEIARICGRQLPKSYNSTYNKMKVVLRTDDTTNLDGFKAQWEPICGGQYIATSNEKVLYSPNFPGRYPRNIVCSYDIVSPRDEFLLIKFNKFELQGTYPECEFDNLTITTNNNYINDVNVYCGHELPSIARSLHKVSLVFRSDHLYTRYPLSGFKLTYSVYQCGGHVQEPTILTSDFNNYSEENMNCTWHIQAPSNRIVVLKLLYVDLGYCDENFVAIFDGFFIKNDKRLALICGHSNTTIVLRSHGDKLLVQFVTYQIVYYKGFKAEVLFSLTEAAGCGGEIDLTATASQTLKSLVGNNGIYEKYLDCQWIITSPPGTVVKIKFIHFHIAPCRNANQTELGITNCACDLVEIKDGVNPDSLTIGTYCGHSLPPALFSSGNLMSIRLSTDGENESSGFEVQLSVQPSLCGQSQFVATRTVQHIKSPGFGFGSVPRGLHCVYYLDPGSHADFVVRISFVTLDLQAATNQGTVSKCVKDKISIINHHKTNSQNVPLGKDYMINHSEATLFNNVFYMERTLPRRIEICGTKKLSDLYLSGHTAITLTTSPETDSRNYKGFEIEFVLIGFCDRNYTDTYGKISRYSSYNMTNLNDCYTLITAPENSTISAYFANTYWYDYKKSFLDIYDGKDISSPKLLSFTYNGNNEVNPVFSTGRYMLLHSHKDGDSLYYIDLNYVTTDKGRGCGGKLINELGRVTSPMYPQEYRKQSYCEWELETPYGTRIKLHFSVFDLGTLCEQNYLQLVNNKGMVISTFCSETPADYTSDDNYVKIVFVTSVNNGGLGWVADFVGII